MSTAAAPTPAPAISSRRVRPDESMLVVFIGRSLPQSFHGRCPVRRIESGMVTRHRATLLGIAISATLAAVLIARFSDAPYAQASPQAETTARIVTAAQAVVASVDAGARAKLVFPFDSPQKTNWSNLPSGIYQRNSVKLGDLSAPQRRRS